MSAPSDTHFRLGWLTARGGGLFKSCPYDAGTPEAAQWKDAYKLGAKVGRGRQNDDPWCEQPTDCRSLIKLCVRCRMKQLHASDPEYRAQRTAAIHKANAMWRADPARRAEHKARMGVLLTELNRSPEFKKKRAATMKRRHAEEPGFTEKMTKGIMAHSKSEGHRKTAVKRLAKVHARQKAAKNKRPAKHK